MKNIGLYEFSEKPNALKWANAAAKLFIERGVKVCARPEAVESFDADIKNKVEPLCFKDFHKFADIVATFGGDGTILSAAQFFLHNDIPIMGFNVGKLGFLAEYSVDRLEQSVDDILKGNYRIVDRAALETKVNGEKLYALNDVVIEKKASSRMIIVKAYANDRFIGDYRADGLILNTPTGSTAYSLSCGGPVIAPSTPVVCLTPISPHSLTFRPLVIPDTNEIKLIIQSHSGMANLVLDGQIERTVEDMQEIIINLSESRVKLIKPMDGTFYDLIRQKLLWSVNAVEEKH